MAATVGAFQFVGAASGRSYSKDIYLSDTANGLINFDSGGGASATTETFWTAPEPIYLTDYAVTTGYAQTKLQIIRNGVPTGDILRHGIHLDTLNNRPRLGIPFNAGDKLAAIQLA